MQRQRDARVLMPPPRSLAPNRVRSVEKRALPSSSNTSNSTSGNSFKNSSPSSTQRKEQDEEEEPSPISFIPSMAAVVRSVWQGIKEKGLTNFLRYARDEGYLKCLGDGNLLQTKIHNIGATLVGVDNFGNKYYEKLHDTQYGRHRWVEYADKGRYNASQVPAEWHGWLHHITDSTGDKLLEEKTKKYIVEHRQNFTGQGDDLIYHSKGHALNPGQRDWTRYQPWEPKKEETS